MTDIPILYEDDEALVIDKPAGLTVHSALHHHADKTSVYETLVDWLRVNRPETANVGDDPKTRPGIVHRLDRDTSGVMLIAKTQDAFERFKKQFQDRTVRKEYIAVVRGKLRSRVGTIDAAIGIVSGSTRRSTRSTKMAKAAVTDYEVLHEREDSSGHSVSVLAVYPRTGRTHQIRVHLASLGHPILGDRLYGARRSESPEVSRLMLHARSLEFSPHAGQSLRIEATPPREFDVYLTYIKITGLTR